MQAAWQAVASQGGQRLASISGRRNEGSEQVNPAVGGEGGIGSRKNWELKEGALQVVLRIGEISRKSR